jgi:FKBP-type peptidyl-prolyl cis-trans isomerase
MRAVLLWLLTLVSIAAAVFFWLRQSDLQSRLDGLAASSIAQATTSQGELARLREMETLVDVLDRAFARGLNGQDSLSRDFARLTTSADQAELRSAIEARLEKLKSDMEGPARSVRDLLLTIDPPDYTLDPEKISDAANAAFLAKIDADPSYTRTASGLRYKSLKTLDSGAKPTPENEVTVHYRGTFIEGTEFDSSYKTGEPATFTLDRLIAGWVEGIPLMKQGEIFELILPYDLAYGVAGRSSIPPRQTLVFQVELLKVSPPPPAATP